MVSIVFFGQNADRIESIARVFPVFFFLVAALVASTTMTRMVEENRTQMGTFKALGYTDREITAKYLVYGTTAGLLGCIAGMLLGFFGVPVGHLVGLLHRVRPAHLPAAGLSPAGRPERSHQHRRGGP